MHELRNYAARLVAFGLFGLTVLTGCSSTKLSHQPTLCPKPPSNLLILPPDLPPLLADQEQPTISQNGP